MLSDSALVYAAELGSVEVVFQRSDEFGWHAHVHATSGECLLGLPWGDHLDRTLSQSPEDLPFGVGLDEVWQDEDEGWHAEVAVVGANVYVAESFERPYLLVPSETGTGTIGNNWDPPSVHPCTDPTKGRVRINQAEATIYSVPQHEWERAWGQARLSCLAGDPRPSVGDWADTPAHQND